MDDFRYDFVYEMGLQVCSLMFFERNLMYQCFTFDEFMKWWVFQFCCHALKLLYVKCLICNAREALLSSCPLLFLPVSTSHHRQDHAPSLPFRSSLTSLLYNWPSFQTHPHSTTTFFYTNPDQPATSLPQWYRRNSCVLITVLFFLFCIFCLMMPKYCY